MTSLALLLLLSLFSVPCAVGTESSIASTLVQEPLSVDADDKVFVVDHVVHSPTLDSLSEFASDFTTFKHPSFPNTSLRIKKAPRGWCDPFVDKYTGYIDVSPARHLFFYFFESRRKPAEDPVVLWTNGGPGGSSTLGLFLELGPCTIISSNETTMNPYSWNDAANIFFIEQPLGTGFSYTDFGEKVSTADEAANDIADFVAMFFETFKFQGRPFHLAGESYAGRLLPVYAAKIYDRNQQLRARGHTPINLKSIMLGNGYTSRYHMISSYFNVSCTPILYEQPAIDILTCVKIKTVIPRCQKWLKESCYDSFDHISCGAAQTFCEEAIGGPYANSGMNPYDVSKMCDGKYEDTSCYPGTIKLLDYLNNPATRKLLGVSPKLDNYSMPLTAFDVFWRFNNNLDAMSERTEYYVENLLDRGVDVLLYVGSYDFVCNWVGVENMVKTLKWKDSEEFHRQEWRDWHVASTPEIAGRVKTAGGLTFLTIQGAGHLAPHDKPKESLYMFRKWMYRSPF